MPPITCQDLFEKRQQGKDLRSRRFGEKKTIPEKDSAGELVSKAFYGALNTLDGCARPAPTGPAAEARAKL